LLLVQCKVRTGAKRLTLGIRFAWFLVAFLALLDRWAAIFDASPDLISIYALDFLDFVVAFYSVYRKRRAKDDKAPHKITEHFGMQVGASSDLSVGFYFPLGHAAISMSGSQPVFVRVV
jgi:hypothetical protein